MKILIVDDEPLARARLVRMLAAIPDTQVVGEAEQGAQALELAAKLQPQVVLLDIEMPGMSGVDVARELAAQQPAPAVLFCTAHDEYAINAFDAAAVAYLVKPVEAAQLAQALKRAATLNRAQLEVFSQAAPADAPRLKLRRDEDIQLMPVSDVIGFRADNKRVFVVCDDGEHFVEESLVELEAAYPEYLTRVHRAALVVTGRVAGLTRDGLSGFRLKLQHSDWAPAVSRRHLPAVRRLLNQR